MAEKCPVQFASILPFLKGRCVSVIIHAHINPIGTKLQTYIFSIVSWSNQIMITWQAICRAQRKFVTVDCTSLIDKPPTELTLKLLSVVNRQHDNIKGNCVLSPSYYYSHFEWK